MNSYLLLIGLGLFKIDYVINFLTILLKFIDVHMYSFRYDAESQGDVMTLISNETMTSSITLIKSRKIPSGYFVNWKSFGFIDSASAYAFCDIRITIITTSAYYNYLTKKKEIFFNCGVEETLSKPTSEIKVYNRYGSYQNFGYTSLTLNLKNLHPLPSQKVVIDDIILKYKTKNHLVVFIEGIPCSGKSSIGYLLAKELSASFCHTFNPSEPGDTLSNVISCIKYGGDQSDGPIVIILEEVDIIINNIHNGKIPLNKSIPISVKDKPSWNSFLDDIFFYENIILILTSNKTRTEINNLDKAYIRRGRVDLFYEMNTEITE